jgi:hypothetical protein
MRLKTIIPNLNKINLGILLLDEALPSEVYLEGAAAPNI